MAALARADPLVDIDDPSEAIGNEEQQLAVFRRIALELRHRLGLFVLANKMAPELRLL